MKVRIYAGLLGLIEKSGVGQAIHHQEAMLKEAGIPTTYKNEKDVSFVHINTIFPDSLVASLIARCRKQKVVYYGHSTMEDFRNSFKLSNFFAPLFKQWIKFCYSTGDIIITPTEYSKKLISSYGIQKPIFALSNGIDTHFFKASKENRDRFRAKYNLKDDEKVVLSVGHFIERKGIIEFIELAKMMPHVKFFWFGHSQKQFITTDVENAIKNAPKNVIFPGVVNQEGIRDAYCGCDLFCFMSYEETEGIVVLEALSSSIPVLVRDIPVYSSWLHDGVNVEKCNSTLMFCEKAKRILDCPNKEIIQHGLETANNKSIANISQKLVSIYGSVIGSVLESKHHFIMPKRFIQIR